MKIAATTMMATLLAVTAQAGEGTDSHAERKVTVCMQGTINPEVEVTAKWVASRMFAAIGVTIDWRLGFSGCPSRAIMISLTDNTPTSLLPGALAYALPYEGTHIRVFYDRISQNYNKTLVPRLMGHVLAHEITHILEGVSRHSAYGVMKAPWVSRDYSQMQVKSLEFADEDIDLIYRGLAVREARAIVAMNATAERLAAR
jgi:hypothetical protein